MISQKNTSKTDFKYFQSNLDDMNYFTRNKIQRCLAHGLDQKKCKIFCLNNKIRWLKAQVEKFKYLKIQI